MSLKTIQEELFTAFYNRAQVTTSSPPMDNYGGHPILVSTYYLETGIGIETIAPKFRGYKKKVTERFGSCEMVANKIKNKEFRKTNATKVIGYINEHCPK